MKYKSVLLAVFFLALFVRLYAVGYGTIFGYDQARDAYRARSIVHERNILLLGPETDIPGVHHGVGYYYLMAIPFAVSNSPVVAVSFIAVICSLFVFFLYRSLLDVFGSERIAIAVSLLYAVSFEMVQYARWLSNPVLGTLTVYCVWYFLTTYLRRGDQRSLLLAFFFAGLSIHFQLFLLYVAAFVFIVPVVRRRLFRLGHYLKGVFVYVLFLVPFLISEYRFGGQLTKSFGIFLSNASVYHSPAEILSKIFFRMESVMSHLLVPGHPYIAISIFLFSFIYVAYVLSAKKTKPDIKLALGLLVVWHILTYAVYIFSSGAVGTEFSFVGGVTSVIVIVGFALGHMLDQGKFALPAVLGLVMLVVFNLITDLKEARLGSYLFSVQLSFTYGREKELIDYVYDGAKESKQFSICTLTNPFYVNTTWSYLFSTYGKSKYGYTPFWAGSDQSRLLGGGDLQADTVKPSLRYLIYEPPAGMPDYMPSYFRKIENFISTNTETKKFGELVVEKRELKTAQELAKNSNNDEYRHQLENGKLFSCYN